ncbi:dihydrofolate reductase [Longilinea arvoryzae]|uniref:Dihydrofolate reductase n=1 Tax=Longilinea arvoryzae TaxID=360412 RepID=A0A0S7BEZ1_9CHLR|nr:dihydrofolate reductase family protein [Longilinea arvoryzae]GAP13014.1 dihydrofolate reductase [Longilinea arvoryzae]
MRKLIVTEFVSLDGGMEEPGLWSLPYWNAEIAQFKGAEFSACDAQLLGRVTYEGFAKAWPKSTDEGAEQFNSMPKYVVTRTLKTLEWNNSHPIRGDITAAVKDLKGQPGKDIVVSGSGMLVDFLLSAGLVDELHLLVYPLLLGKGKRIFTNSAQSALRLVSSRTFAGGVLALIYAPA